jgi:hypothetical protein
MITLAKTQQRVVDLEGLLQAERERQLGDAIAALSELDQLTLIVLMFHLRDSPGPPVMDTAGFVRWLRAELPPRGLPRPYRPLLAQAREQAQRFIDAVASGQPSGEEHQGWACWLHDVGAAAGSWVE